MILLIKPQTEMMFACETVKTEHGPKDAREADDWLWEQSVSAHS